MIIKRSKFLASSACLIDRLLILNDKLPPEVKNPQQKGTAPEIEVQILSIWVEFLHIVSDVSWL